MKHTFEEGLQVVNIELTTYCNLSCKYCSKNKFGHELKGKNMDWGLYCKILDLLPKDITLALYLSGEPLMLPNLHEYIRFAKERGFKETRIHTNATLLDEGMTHKLVESGLGSIVFSIDGIDAHDYKKLRGHDFWSVKKNIEYFLDVNQGRIKTGVQCLVPVSIPKMLNSDLEDIRDRFDFLILDHPHSWVYGDKIEGAKYIGVTDIPCFFLDRYMTIAVDGDYLPCCCCLNKEMVLGNVSDRTPEEIWNNEIEELRQRQICGEYISLCGECERNRELVDDD